MGSNQKQTQMDQKAYVERKLKNRLSFLSEKGIESPNILKDTIVKNLRASIGGINVRLKAIARTEEKTEGLAKAKAEKAAAPQKEMKDSKETKTKEAPAAGKEKKKKKG